jgi:hypothetical protein
MSRRPLRSMIGVMFGLHPIRPITSYLGFGMTSVKGSSRCLGQLGPDAPRVQVAHVMSRQRVGGVKRHVVPVRWNKCDCSSTTPHLGCQARTIWGWHQCGFVATWTTCSTPYTCLYHPRREKMFQHDYILTST